MTDIDKRSDNGRASEKAPGVRLSRRHTVIGGLGLLTTAVFASPLLRKLGVGGTGDATGTQGVTVVSGGAGAGAGSASASQQLATAGTAGPILPLSTGSGDAFLAFMNFDPTSDADAPYFRSIVPLASRIAAFAATQAHPALDSRPGAATLASTNRTIARTAADVWRAVRQAAMPAGGVQVSRRLGAHDIVVQWAGTRLLPNPALTDTAHRNGALCLGTIFQPDPRMYNGTVYTVLQVASKFVALARYFGFDGYFMNHELGDQTSNAQVAVLMATMRSVAAQQGLTRFHVQHYNGGTDLGSLFASGSAGSGPAANTVMIDQGWSGYGGPGGCCGGAAVTPSTVAPSTAAYQRTPFDVYYGFQLYPGPGYIGVAAPSVISPNDGRFAYGGLQFYSLDDGFLNIYRARIENKGAAFLPANITIPAVEQLIYSGQTANPALDNTPSSAQAAVYAQGRYYSEVATTNGLPSNGFPDQANLPITYGVANFITERSVVSAMPFVTHFNTGDGTGFFADGMQVSTQPWFALGVQDVLPTWQWWRAPFAGLTDRSRDAAGLLTVAFDQTSAYDGGTSLRVTGTLGSSNATRVHLFKTDVSIASTAQSPVIEIVSKAAAADLSRTRIGLVFVDQPNAPVWLALGTATALSGSGWGVSRIDLRPYRGRRLASILLGFQASGSGSQAIDVRFGRLALLDGTAAAPAAPTALALDRRVTDATTGAIGLALKWKGAGRYDIFRIVGGSARTWIGRIDGECFYSPTALPAGTGSATIEVQAIGTGIRGGSARIQV